MPDTKALYRLQFPATICLSVEAASEDEAIKEGKAVRDKFIDGFDILQDDLDTKTTDERGYFDDNADPEVVMQIVEIDEEDDE